LLDSLIPPAVLKLPTLNACLNTTSTVFLLLGYRCIRQGKINTHRRFMLGALAASSLFLVSYLVYHFYVGSVPYPHQDWTRPVYFAILIPHIVLAPTMLPFIAVVVWRALRGNFVQHRRLARFVWPVWIFVSLTGVIIYLMLYRL
jgi:putative membrane protein